MQPQPTNYWEHQKHAVFMYLQQQSARLQHFEFTCKNSNVSIFNCMIVAIYFFWRKALNFECRINDSMHEYDWVPYASICCDI